MAEKLPRNSLNDSKDSESSSFYQERSSFLKSRKIQQAQMKIRFNFIVTSPLNEIRTFLITITKKKFPNVFYGYDSTSFLLVRCERDLKKSHRYLIYGKLSKNRFYFLECLKEEKVDYKSLCYMLI